MQIVQDKTIDYYAEDEFDPNPDLQQQLQQELAARQQI